MIPWKQRHDHGPGQHDHGHSHGPGQHDHGPGHVHGGERGLRLALALTAVILLVEATGGVLSHSLALLADAGHVVTDLGALGLALFAARQAHRPADHTRTFGYHRTGILVALFNACALIAIAVLIVYEAYGRLLHPGPINPWPMTVAAAIGLSINLFVATRLHGHSHGDLNVRGAWLHVVGDAGASAGVIVAALAIALTHWTPLDPLLSAAIAVLIAAGAWRLMSDALAILMESTPRGLDVPAMVREMSAVPGVLDVHDVHVWSIGPNQTMLSCHVHLGEQSLTQGLQVVDRLNTLLGERFGIAHCTIQPEVVGCTGAKLHCALPCGCEDHPHRATSRRVIASR